MTAKIDVTGENAHEIYQWLTKKELNNKGDYSICWNFNKFLLDEERQIIEHFELNIKPLEDAIVLLL